MLTCSSVTTWGRSPSSHGYISVRSLIYETFTEHQLSVSHCAEVLGVQLIVAAGDGKAVCLS